jgi:aspartate aminotransferase
VLLSPGQRLGYLALSPLMPQEDRDSLRRTVFGVQMAIGWCFPNAIMQYAVPDLENLSIDIKALTNKRDRLSAALEEAGCQILRSEGTFYMWVRWPEGDPDVLWNSLADRDVFVMPGSVMGAPSYFRLSLTASEAMVERALPAIAEMRTTSTRSQTRQTG